MRRSDQELMMPDKATIKAAMSERDAEYHPQGWLERKLEALLDRNSGLTDTQRLWALIYLTGELAKELRIYQKIK